METTTAPSTPVATVPAAAPATRWVMDAAHSHVSFSVRHMMISNVRGEFGKATGEVSFPGTTREVKLAVDEITGVHGDPWGNARMGASARTKIRRSDFGMRWNAALEAGGVLVGDEVTIQLEVELIRQS
jgi:polyisoprenoid-binding protein YceI